VHDARKCISYQTIEQKEMIPEKLKGLFKNRLFGCDICQDVCPYNKKPLITSEKAFLPKSGISGMTFYEWEEMDLNQFEAKFRTSALMRTGFSGLKRNLDFLKS
jgi:epoxyqueuosine reductase